MSVVDNLVLINEYKNDIRAAIEDKGVDMSGVSLSGYADKIGEISGGGGEESPYDGHVDEVNLRQLGWSEEDINRLKSAVDWYAWADDDYRVTSDDIVRDAKASYQNNWAMLYPKPWTGTWGSNTFYGCKNMIAVPSVNIGGVINISQMFGDCWSLVSVPLFNTSAVTNMSSMFYECHSLKSVPHFDTGSATSMNYMFYNCYSLKSVPQYNTGSVTNMNNMFYNCNSLNTIPLFDTKSVTNMSSMFHLCRSLTTIPQIDTSSVTTMENMFNQCFSLKSIPPMDTSSVTNMNNMFYTCYTLRYVEGIDFSSMTAAPSGFLTSCDYIKRFIVNGSINFTWNGSNGLDKLTKIDFQSIYSILSAMSRCNNPETAKTMKLNLSIEDGKDGELAALVADCESKGWTITGLTLK